MYVAEKFARATADGMELGLAWGFAINEAYAAGLIVEGTLTGALGATVLAGVASLPLSALIGLGLSVAAAAEINCDIANNFELMANESGTWASECLGRSTDISLSTADIDMLSV